VYTPLNQGQIAGARLLPFGFEKLEPIGRELEAVVLNNRCKSAEFGRRIPATHTESTSYYLKKLQISPQKHPFFTPKQPFFTQIHPQNSHFSPRNR
jgi:ribosomal protein L31